MESGVSFACAVGNALVKGKDLKELLELQVALQLISSIVNGAIQSLRLSPGFNPIPSPAQGE